MQSEQQLATESSIQFLSGPLAGKSFPLTRSSMTLGRAPENDIVINDVGVSRTHARLIQTSSGWSIEKLASQNIITINQRDTQQGTLANQDIVGLGTASTFRFTSTNLGATILPQASPMGFAPTVAVSKPQMPTPPPPSWSYPAPMSAPISVVQPMPMQSSPARPAASPFSQGLSFGIILGLILTAVYLLDFALHFWVSSANQNTYHAFLLLFILVLYIVVPLIAGMQIAKRNTATSAAPLTGMFTSIMGLLFTTIPIVLMFILITVIKTASNDLIYLPLAAVAYSFLTGLPGIMLGAVGGLIGGVINKRLTT